MDLFLILLGMTAGVFGGLLAAQAVPQPGPELYSLFATIGMLVGAFGGYFFAWVLKDVLRSRNHLPARRPSPPIAGNYCHTCDARIILITDGHACPKCSQVYCKKCQPQVPCSQCRNKIPAGTPDDHNKQT